MDTFLIMGRLFELLLNYTALEIKYFRSMILHRWRYWSYCSSVFGR